jgi:hypothetical protein
MDQVYETATARQFAAASLTRSEVERLRDIGLVEESVDFGGGEVLAYRLLSHLEPGAVQARFRQGTVTVSVATKLLKPGRLRRKSAFMRNPAPSLFRLKRTSAV